MVNSEFGINLDINENRVNVLVIENPQILRSAFSELIRQCEGAEGNFVLSQSDKFMNLSKQAYTIIEPLTIDFNSHRIQAKLFQQIKSYVEESLNELTGELNQRMTLYLEQIALNMPFVMEYDLDFEIQNLLKMYHVRISSSEESLVENILEYIKIHFQLFSKNLVVFLNLKTWVSKEELKNIYEYAFYSKINLILVESNCRKDFDCEQMTVIDADCCVISY